MRLIRSRLCIAPLPVAVLLLAGACTNAPAPTSASQRAPSTLTAPPTSGPFVVRLGDRPVFFFAADERHNLMSIHFPLDIAFCGGSSTPNLADITFVTTPSAVQSVLALIKDDDGAVEIYNTSDFTEAFGPGGFGSDIPLFCAFMNGPKKIAEGIARRRSAFSGNSFSASWSGILSDVDGNPVHYAEQHLFTIDPLTAARTEVVSSIQLH